MTEEEMAEKYAHNHVHYEVAKRENGSEYAKEVSSVTIKEAFLAGLKAGKNMNAPIKWHILAENPTLPKEGQRVRVLTEEGVIEESTLFYDTYFEELTWSNIGLLKVLAWKEIEIPKENE